MPNPAWVDGKSADMRIPCDASMPTNPTNTSAPTPPLGEHGLGLLLGDALAGLRAARDAGERPARLRLELGGEVVEDLRLGSAAKFHRGAPPGNVPKGRTLGAAGRGNRGFG
jgi:hypothetical protein